MRRYNLQKLIYGHGASRSTDEGDEFLQVYQAVVDQSSRLLFTADDTGLIKVWSVSTFALLHSLRGHYLRLRLMEVTKCNKFLITACERMFRVWSVGQMACIYCLKVEEFTHRSSIKEFEIYEKKRLLVVAHGGGMIKVFPLEEF